MRRNGCRVGNRLNLGKPLRVLVLPLAAFPLSRGEKMKYHEQIKHPLWQKKRLEVLEANDFECEDCGSKDEQLHVHHPYYKRGAMVWEYDTHELRCLCNKCHKDAHAIDEEIKIALSCVDTRDSKKLILGYIDSLCYPPRHFEDEKYMEGYVDGIRTNNTQIRYYLEKQFNTAQGKPVCPF